jgi:hypothetical protein
MAAGAAAMAGGAATLQKSPFMYLPASPATAVMVVTVSFGRKKIWRRVHDSRPRQDRW